ncbi:hypothetical protein [Soonwooa sp.]|uniref:hypothetical protein n=1 Tax=Soonwooa sp. TaxID=1938592 RepID=UPI00262232FD|nr:hypothetical protein [Soonwooa sp.]
MKKLILAALVMTGGIVAVSAQQTKKAKKVETVEVNLVEVKDAQSPTPADGTMTKSESNKSIIANDKKLRSKLNREEPNKQLLLQENQPAKVEEVKKIEKVE